MKDYNDIKVLLIEGRAGVAYGEIAACVGL